MPARAPGVYVSEIDQSDFLDPAGPTVVGVIGAATKGNVNVPTLVTSEVDLVTKFGNPLATDYGLHAAAQFLRFSNRLYFLRVANGEATAAISVVNDIDDLTPFVGMVITVKSPGSWGNTIRVRIYDVVEVAAVVGPPAVAAHKRFNLEILAPADVQQTTWVSVEKWETNDNAQKLSTLDTSDYFVETIMEDGNTTLQIASSDYVDIEVVDANFGGNALVELPGTGWTENYYPVGDPTGEVVIARPETVPVSGLDGIPGGGIPDADYIGAVVGQTATGLKAFANKEEVVIDALAIPGISSISVISASGGMIDTCEARGDCVAIIDPPFGLAYDDMIAWHNGTTPYSHARLNSTYAATFWPWIQSYDVYSRKNIWTPPSGHILKVFSQSEAAAGVHFAAAGTRRGRISSAIDVEVKLSDQGQRDALYTGGNNVNGIVNLVPEGIHVWGNKTLQRTTTLTQYLHIRRWLNISKRVMDRTARSLVFEPNDDTLKAQFVALLSPYFEAQKTARAIFDFRITPGVQSSAETDAGIFTGRVSVKPIAAAENINIDFVVQASGAQFTEA